MLEQNGPITRSYFKSHYSIYVLYIYYGINMFTIELIRMMIILLFNDPFVNYFKNVQTIVLLKGQHLYQKFRY